jgi:hypothetical protein
LRDWLHFELYDKWNDVMTYRIDTVTGEIDVRRLGAWIVLYDPNIVVNDYPKWMEEKIQDMYGR